MPEKNQLHPDLARIYDIFGLHYSHPVSVLEVNVRNTKRFSDLLQAVESEFLMVPGTPSDEPEDEGFPVDDQCLVNRWGSTQEEYIEQFRAALEHLNGKSRAITLSGCESTVLSKCVLCDQLQADLTARDQQIDALRQGMKGDYDLDAWLAFVDEAPQLRLDAGRYRWLRSRDLETISQGGVFAGMTPDNLVLNKETLDQAIDAAKAKPKCRHCGDTGQIMVGRSGQAEDGNAPIMEPCEDCDRGMPDLASRPEERGTPETEPCSGCGTPGWTGACNKCVPY